MNEADKSYSGKMSKKLAEKLGTKLAEQADNKKLNLTNLAKELADRKLNAEKETA
jgi:predicted HicB family RNase H-like nuclease